MSKLEQLKKEFEEIKWLIYHENGTMTGIKGEKILHVKAFLDKVWNEAIEECVKCKPVEQENAEFTSTDDLEANPDKAMRIGYNDGIEDYKANITKLKI